MTKFEAEVESVVKELSAAITDIDPRIVAVVPSAVHLSKLSTPAMIALVLAGAYNFVPCQKAPAPAPGPISGESSGESSSENQEKAESKPKKRITKKASQNDPA